MRRGPWLQLLYHMSSLQKQKNRPHFNIPILVNLPHRLLVSEEILHGKLSGGDTASQALRCSTSPISFGTPVEERQFGWTISVVRNLVNQSPTARRAWGPITASTPDDCRINRKRAPLLCLLCIGHLVRLSVHLHCITDRSYPPTSA